MCVLFVRTVHMLTDFRVKIIYRQFNMHNHFLYDFNGAELIDAPNYEDLV